MADDCNHTLFGDDSDGGPTEHDELLDRLSELDEKVDAIAASLENASRTAEPYRRSNSFGIIVVGGVVGLVLAYMVNRTLYPTIGSYPAVKQQDGTLKPLNRVIYKVNLITETITYWTPGRYQTPRKLENCAIRSERDWIASHHFGGVVEMRKGKLAKQDPPAGQDPNEIYIGRTHWGGERGQSSDLSMY